MRKPPSRTRAALGALATAATGLIVLAGPTSAFADYDESSCIAPPGKMCQTKPIPSHRSQHWVRVSVGANAQYLVMDLETQAVVDSGRGTNDWKTIYGLYGDHYQLAILSNGPAVQGTIANCTSLCNRR